MALEDNIENAPLRMAKGQKSYNGLKVSAGQIMEEMNTDLRWPWCMETYKVMFKDATIAPALNLMEMDIGKAEWVVKIPEGYEEQLKEKADFLRSVMSDMEHTWNDFIRQSATFNRYGFAPVEKVYRRRTKANGSKYNDGLIGIKSLPLISQETIASWYWDESGRSLQGLKQWINIPKWDNDFSVSYTQQKVDIPRNKFILFRADPQKDSPIGTSPLNSVYVAWRFKSELERYESTSIAQDLRGLKVIKIPPRYLNEDASEDEKQTAEAFREILRSLHAGEQSGVLLPMAYDDSGKPLFDFELKSVMGQATHDVDKVISRYRKEVVTGLLCPMLTLGQDGSGSFALAENLEHLTKTVISARLKELRDQLNHDLVKQLFMLNGWNTDVMPYFDFVNSQDTSLDELSKYVQRIASVGGLKFDADAVNFLHEQAGLPKAFDNTDITIEDVRMQTTAYSSGASGGMSKGSSNGTSDSAAKQDNSISNLEN
jgi:hypothetical protein